MHILETNCIYLLPCYQHTRLMQVVCNNAAANKIVKSFKLSLSIVLSSVAMNGASVWWQRLSEEICKILQARNEHDAKLALIDTIPQPMESHIQRFDIFGITVWLARPIAHSLSQKITVGGWGCPRSERMRRSSRASRAAAQRPAYSASATNETTTGILVEWAETGWLMVGSSSGRVDPR
jgi:hypothetical protein